MATEARIKAAAGQDLLEILVDERSAVEEVRALVERGQADGEVADYFADLAISLERILQGIDDYVGVAAAGEVG